MGTHISERPKDVKSRDAFGHWELDSMVSSRGESKGCFAIDKPFWGNTCPTVKIKN